VHDTARLFGRPTNHDQGQEGQKILARTSLPSFALVGYTPNQILDIATELIDLVTTDWRMKVDGAQKPEFGRVVIRRVPFRGRAKGSGRFPAAEAP